MCATGTPASPDASVPASVEFVSPKTSVQSGRSRSIASRDPRPHRRGVGGVEVEPVARLRQPELLVEDVGEFGVPVLPGVEADLLDPGVGERGRERAGLDELRPVADDGEDLHAADVTMAAASGPLAQLVEQGTLNPKVEGSNPSRPISFAPSARGGNRRLRVVRDVAFVVCRIGRRAPGRWSGASRTRGARDVLVRRPIRASRPASSPAIVSTGLRSRGATERYDVFAISARSAALTDRARGDVMRSRRPAI